MFPGITIKHRLAIVFLLFSLSVVAQPLNDIRICIDAGHGGHTSDDRQIFLPNGIIYWESEGDLETAFHLRDYLESLGAQVKLTRTNNEDDSDIALSERSAIANAFSADYFHSIHTNGGGGTYSLVLYKEQNGNPAFPQALEMAGIMSPFLQDLMKTNSNIVRGDISFLGFNLGVLNYAGMPSTLSESSFHDLPEEGLRLKNSKYLQNYAWAMAKSFLDYFEAGAFQTGRVGGVVKDVTYGTVINEIQVLCQPGDQQYTGDQYYNGFYAIDSLDPGDYELIISKPGYLNDTAAITITANEYLDMDLTIQYFNNGFPNVDFYISGLPAGAGETVTFNAAHSTDDGTIEAFVWDFGDGTDLDSGMITHHAFDQDGSFDVTLMATDNDGNESSITKTVEIVTMPPSTPRLISIAPQEGAGVRIKWQRGPETNLMNYKFYISEQRDFNDTVDVYTIAAELTPTFDIVLNEYGKSYFYRLTSENIADLESDHGDTYISYNSEDTSSQYILIVDGFNRNGSYTKANHDFAVTYSKALISAGEFNIASCSNMGIISGDIDLKNYDIVFWFLGDESTADETFNLTEQNKVKEFLENGGKLFVTGAEIGWDLVAKGSPGDKLFYENFLKATYKADGGAGRNPATGLTGSGFDETNLNFGQVYPEDYPDEIDEFEGSEKILKYSNNAFAGIKYRGIFGEGQKEGGLVYIGFPLESVAQETEIEYFVQKVIAFFNSIPSNTTNDAEPDGQFEIYPTSVQNRVDIYHDLSAPEQVEVLITAISAQEFYQGIHMVNTGKSKFSIFLNEAPSGIYFVTIKTRNSKETFKIHVY